MNSNPNEVPSSQEFLDLLIDQTLSHLHSFQRTGKGYTALQMGASMVASIPKKFPHLTFDQDAIDEIYQGGLDARNQRKSLL